jgi:hypothetical protein
MYFFSSKLYFRLLSAFLLTFVFVSFNQTIYSQKTKSKQEKKSSSSKSTAKPTSSTTAKKTISSKTTKTKSNPKSTAKSGKSSKDQLNSKTTKSKTTKTTAKNQTEKESKSEARKRLAEEKRKADAETAKKRAAQQAALEEKRRRDQAIRAAQAKKNALENSFRTETAQNIANDDISGEDMEVRRAAINALGSRAGTVVVMEAQTGKVVSIVNQEWAIRNTFKPCSTIKLVTAVAGVNKGLIDSDGSVKNKRINLDMTDALAYSNNSYFQAVGSNLGSEAMIFYAKRLGLGQPTGVNAAGEAAGKLPYGNNNLRIYSHGDDYEVTPLQLGVMVSAISNGGKVVIPQIVKSKVQKTSFRGSMRRTIDLPKSDLQSVLPGMIGAAEYGTARRGVDASMGVAGKTGSCIEKGSWVGLFASVAPVANPEYAVIVITRGQKERGKYAAAIAGSVYQVLGRRISNDNQNVARVPLILKPQPKVNAQKAAELDTDKGDDSDDADSAPRRKIVIDRNPISVTSKPKAKSGDLFPPVVIRVKSAVTRDRIVNKK